MSVALLALTVLPLISAAVFLPQMGDRIALGFNAAGEPTRWGSRYELLGAPVLCLLLGIGMYVSAHRQARAVAEKTPAASSFTFERFMRNGLVTVVVLNLVHAYLIVSALTGVGISL